MHFSNSAAVNQFCCLLSTICINKMHRSAGDKWLKKLVATPSKPKSIKLESALSGTARQRCHAGCFTCTVQCTVHVVYYFMFSGAGFYSPKALAVNTRGQVKTLFIISIASWNSSTLCTQCLPDCPNSNRSWACLLSITGSRYRHIAAVSFRYFYS